MDEQQPLLLDLGDVTTGIELMAAPEPPTKVYVPVRRAARQAQGGGNVQGTGNVAVAAEVENTQVMMRNLTQLTRAIAQINDRIEKYAGNDKLGFSEFKLSFTNQRIAHNWEEEESKTKLIASLTGAALSFCTGVNIEAHTTSTLLSLLQRRFDDEHLVELNEARFNTLQKKASQTWLDFVNNLQRLAQKAFPEFNMVAKERMVSIKLIEQIPYNTLSTYVKINHIKDSERICSLILEWPTLSPLNADTEESTTEEETQINWLKSLEQRVQQMEGVRKIGARVNDMSFEPMVKTKYIRCVKCGSLDHRTMTCPLSDRKCFSCGVVGHIVANCPGVGESRTKGPSMYNLDRQPSMLSDDRRCYKCEGLGHIARNCPGMGKVMHMVQSTKDREVGVTEQDFYRGLEQGGKYQPFGNRPRRK